jgi:hypothetical protein
MKRTFAAVVLAVCGIGTCAFAAPADVLPEIVTKVFSEDVAIRQWATDWLRAQGRPGLEPLLAMRSDLQKKIADPNFAQRPSDSSELQAKLEKLEAIIDQVAGQRYACHSRLYWYTDLGAAKNAAKAQNKPILSLRMLGKLTEDFSCANSRFFRTTLYANEEVSALLREKFVLHWQSVRPVPRVTIDFGDGRKLERTLTGNSIHYVLTADEEVVDALPGLYGPTAFIDQLNTSLNVVAALQERDSVARDQLLISHHQQRLEQLEEAWAKDYQEATRLLSGAPIVDPRAVLEAATRQLAQPQPGRTTEPPTAATAARVAVPKRMVEARLVKAAVPSDATDPAAVTDERLWQVIAQLHAQESKLDDASLTLIRSQNPVAAHAARLAMTKARVEDPLVRMVRSLEGSIAIDTVRNEYQLHRQIHAWLAAKPEKNVIALNERVYAQLFLTPGSDPWLGLAPVDSYTALPNGGVAKAE